MGFTRKLISSEKISSPAAIVTLSAPPKVTSRAPCKLISLSDIAGAIVTIESVIGSVPQKLEKCNLTVLPPNAHFYRIPKRNILGISFGSVFGNRRSVAPDCYPFTHLFLRKRRYTPIYAVFKEKTYRRNKYVFLLF